MLLPARDGVGTAETYDDLAGVGRRHVGLALAMAVSCFSLIGIPLTVGFVGKLMLIKPALEGGLTWLVIILVINAAISAAYYLKIVATMFLRPEAGVGPAEVAGAPIASRTRPQVAVLAAVLASVIGTILFGSIPKATERLAARANARSLPVVPDAGPRPAGVAAR
jgi:NADH-quinone oxidoreductase subunit N